MRYMLTPQFVVELAAAIVAFVVAIQGWRRRSIPGGVELSVMMCAVCVWALGSSLAAAAVGVERKVVFAVISYVGSGSVSPLFLLFALRYRKHSWKPAWWQQIALWVLPVLTVGLAATNRFHGLIWSSFTAGTEPGSNTLIYGHGPWFYAAVVYYAALGVVSAMVIGRAAWRAQRMFIGQTVILLSGLLVPWVFTVLYIVPGNPFPGYDLPPIGFAITGPLLMAGMRRFRLLDVVPVARHFLVESMADGVLVLDQWDRAVDVNPSALSLMGRGTEVIGRPAAEALGPLGEALGRLRAQPDGHLEILLRGEVTRFVDIHLSPLVDRDGSSTGSVLVLHDLTERRRLELEREKLIGELQAALGDVKTLSGLLPICSHCKKIRDDSGYWSVLERYITEHSGAEFTHGICPDCMRRLYPELSV